MLRFPVGAPPVVRMDEDSPHEARSLAHRPALQEVQSQPQSPLDERISMEQPVFNEQQIARKFCPACGNKAVPPFKFCGICGHNFVKQASRGYYTRFNVSTVKGYVHNHCKICKVVPFAFHMTDKIPKVQAAKKLHCLHYPPKY